MTNEIGIKLKQLRRAKHLTQEKLSERSGVPRSTLSNYEIGRRTPHLTDLQKLADFYGVGLDYFGFMPTDEVFDLLVRAKQVFNSPDVPPELKEELYRQFMRLYLDNLKPGDENEQKENN